MDWRSSIIAMSIQIPNYTAVNYSMGSLITHLVIVPVYVTFAAVCLVLVISHVPKTYAVAR